MRTAQIGFRIFCLCVIVLAIMQVAFSTPAHSEDHVPVANPGSAPANAAEPVLTPEAKAEAEKKAEAQKHATAAAIAADLEGKKLALESRAQEIDEQEHRLKEREKELEHRLRDLERLRAAVSGELEGQKKQNEEKIAKMVLVFETMAPKPCAAVLETLDDWLAVEVLKQMDVKKVAKVMNTMEKNRSAKLSEMLTGFYRPEKDRSLASAKAAVQQQQPAGQAAQKPVEPNKK